MRPAIVAFLFFMFVCGLWISSVPTGTVLANNTTVLNPAQGIMSYVTSWEQFNWGILVNPMVHVTFFKNLFQILILQGLPIFGASTSSWSAYYMLVWGPIISMVVFGLVVLFIYIIRRNV
jgi:hypothetical protein